MDSVIRQLASRATSRRFASCLLLAVLCGSGCAAWTNPVANGIPVYFLPPELLAEPKEGLETIPLAFLRRKPPEKYILGPEDVLAVYIEGVLGSDDQPPPVSFPENADLPPALGYPIPIRENGTAPLPLIEPIQVAGMTVEEAEEAITKAYTSLEEPILRPGRERIIVTLIRPRQVRILVVRQDSSEGRVSLRTGGSVIATRSIVGGSEVLIGGTRRGSGTVVDLPAYANDLLNALAATGGLPGLDAKNEVIIQRGYLAEGVPEHLGFDPAAFSCPPLAGDVQTVRIPLRLSPGQAPPFGPDDIVLNDGDIVFIESRDAEVYYTGGLLPSGEYPLPRDYDLDVIEAVAQVGGPLVNGGINSNNITGSIVATGIGQPSPRLVSVLRRTPDGRQVNIRIDLEEALRDPRENLLIAAGDVLIMQETPGQAFARYFTTFFNFNLFSEVLDRGSATGSAIINVP
jgi:protein involved in polysaccharide export with SLBB domain